MKTAFLFNLLLFILFSSCNQEKSTSLSSEISEIENGLSPTIKVKSDSITLHNLEERMEHYNIPGVSIAVLKNGKIRWAKGYGMANTENSTKVDTNTLFQAGSISKPLAALAALDLVEKGKLDLDADVNNYLQGWKILENKYTQNEKVSVRRLLTHTAGMTVHGFPGYTHSDTFPSIIEVLNGEGNTPNIFVDTFPGSLWRYSGGGYTVMQKVVEDISGKTFDQYMEENILVPMNLNKSTYEQPLGNDYKSKASAAYDSDGRIIEDWWHNYPEQAAAGLWTTPLDLANYCVEIHNIMTEKKSGILSKETVTHMLTKDKNNWGLGPSLQWERDSLIFRHGGKNAGFTNEFLSFVERGDGVIIMTNADNGGKLIGEILRSVSRFYGWGTNNPRIVETIELPNEKIQNFVGKYKLNFQVPGIGDYIINLSIRDNKLFVEDPNSGETNVLTPMEESKFIDLEIGDEVIFLNENNQQILNWNDRYRFTKIEE